MWFTFLEYISALNCALSSSSCLFLAVSGSNSLELLGDSCISVQGNHSKDSELDIFRIVTCMWPRISPFRCMPGYIELCLHFHERLTPSKLGIGAFDKVSQHSKTMLL